jgi:hypothetical protein
MYLYLFWSVCSTSATYETTEMKFKILFHHCSITYGLFAPKCAQFWKYYIVVLTLAIDQEYTPLNSVILTLLLVDRHGNTAFSPSWVTILVSLGESRRLQSGKKIRFKSGPTKCTLQSEICRMSYKWINKGFKINNTYIGTRISEQPFIMKPGIPSSPNRLRWSQPLYSIMNIRGWNTSHG